MMLRKLLVTAGMVLLLAAFVASMLLLVGMSPWSMLGGLVVAWLFHVQAVQRKVWYPPAAEFRYVVISIFATAVHYPLIVFGAESFAMGYMFYVGVVGCLLNARWVDTSARKYAV